MLTIKLSYGLRFLEIIGTNISFSIRECDFKSSSQLYMSAKASYILNGIEGGIITQYDVFQFRKFLFNLIIMMTSEHIYAVIRIDMLG